MNGEQVTQQVTRRKDRPLLAQTWDVTATPEAATAAVRASEASAQKIGGSTAPTDADAEYRLVAIERLEESPNNPRRTMPAAGLAELEASIRQHGVLTPLLVRPFRIHSHTPGFQILAGTRRFRAAKNAGLAVLPCRIRELNDEQALEIMIVDNLQREDVHPMEEAQGYRALRDRGQDVDAIAAKVGKSASYVYQRLKLAELGQPAQKLFLDGTLSASHAILLARLTASDQDRVLEWIAQESHYEDGVPPPVRDLANWMARYLFHDTKAASFDAKDATLPGGACAACPKLAKNQPAPLEGAKPTTCLDTDCWNAKELALVARAKEQAKQVLGAEVIARGPVLEVSTEHRYGTQARNTKGLPLPPDKWRDAGKKTCKHAQPAVIAEGDKLGTALVVCTHTKCATHWKAAGAGGYSTRTHLSDAEKQKRKAANLKARQITETRKQVVAAILEHTPIEPGRRELQMVAGTMWRRAVHDLQRQVGARRGWTPGKSSWGGKDYEKPGAAWIGAPGQTGGAGTADLVNFLVELCLCGLGLEYREYEGKDADRALREAARAYGVKWEAIEAEARAPFAAKRAKLQASAKTPAKTKPPAKPKVKAAGKGR